MLVNVHANVGTQFIASLYVCHIQLNKSRVHAANLGGFGDTRYGQQIGAHAQAALLLLRLIAYCLVGAFHDVFQLAVDLLLGPEEALKVLHPFKVADGHASGVGEDVGNNGCAAIIEDAIGLWCGGAVGSLDNQVGFDAAGVPAGQLVFQRGGNQHVAGEFEQFGVGDLLGVW